MNDRRDINWKPSRYVKDCYVNEQFAMAGLTGPARIVGTHIRRLPNDSILHSAPYEQSDKDAMRSDRLRVEQEINSAALKGTGHATSVYQRLHTLFPGEPMLQGGRNPDEVSQGKIKPVNERVMLAGMKYTLIK